jgi:hypothetical protein
MSMVMLSADLLSNFEGLYCHDDLLYACTSYHSAVVLLVT